MPINEHKPSPSAAILFRRWTGVGVIAVLMLTLVGCASFKNVDGEPAPFEQLNVCESLGTWVEPLSTRYGTSLKKMSAVKARPLLALLFEDTYFIPVFGAPIDALSGRQMAAISRSFGNVRKRCDLDTYLRSEVPLLFLRDVFHPNPRMHAHINRAFAIQHAMATRGTVAPSLANSTGVDRSTIRRTQRLLDRIGRDVGPIDGLAGERTLQVLRDYKQDEGIEPIDDSITTDLLARLQRDADNTPTNRQPTTPARVTPRPRPANRELTKLLDEHAEWQRQRDAPDAPTQTTKRPSPANTPFLAGLSGDSPNLTKNIQACNRESEMQLYDCFVAGKQLDIGDRYGNSTTKSDPLRALTFYSKACDMGQQDACRAIPDVEGRIANPGPTNEEIQVSTAVANNILENCWSSRIAFDRERMKQPNYGGDAGRQMVSRVESDCVINAGTGKIELSLLKVREVQCNDNVAVRRQCTFTAHMGCLFTLLQTENLSASDPQKQFVNQQVCGNINRSRRATGELVFEDNGQVRAANVEFVDGL